MWSAFVAFLISLRRNPMHAVYIFWSNGLYISGLGTHLDSKKLTKPGRNPCKLIWGITAGFLKCGQRSRIKYMALLCDFVSYNVERIIDISPIAFLENTVPPLPVPVTCFNRAGRKYFWNLLMTTMPSQRTDKWISVRKRESSSKRKYWIFFPIELCMGHANGTTAVYGQRWKFEKFIFQNKLLVKNSVFSVQSFKSSFKYINDTNACHTTAVSGSETSECYILEYNHP